MERLAAAIAERIAGWLAGGRGLPGEDRPIRAGDVMVLVQRRGADLPRGDPGAEAGAACRSPAPTCCGSAPSSRSTTCSPRCASPPRPRDDLSLAAFLRSPLGGLSERELFELAHGRDRQPLGGARAAPAERWPEARALLDDLRDQADYLRPFELLTRMLVRHDGRRRLVARLGPEAEDGIDALLDQALAYESVEPPTLPASSPGSTATW